jgi:hypothetical protein
MKRVSRLILSKWHTSERLGHDIPIRPRDNARVHRKEGRHGHGGESGRPDHDLGGTAVLVFVDLHLVEPHLVDVLVPAVLGLVQVAMLVEHERYPGGILPVGLLERRGGVQLVSGALEQDAAVLEGDGDPSDAGVSEAVCVVAEGLYLVQFRWRY